MNKLIFFFIVLCSFAAAEQVMVLNFHYYDGVITMREKTVMPGYYPDRIFQPEKGYKVEVIGSGKVLYSFRVSMPLEEFTDYVAGNELGGGVMRLNDTDFSLVIPYFADAEEIVFYNERGYKVSEMKLNEEKLSPKGISAAFGFLGLIIIGSILIRRKKGV